MKNYITEIENYLNTYGVQDKDTELARETFRRKGNAKVKEIIFLSTLPETVKANRAEKRNTDIYLRDRKRAIKTLRKTVKGNLPEDLIFNQMISSYIRSKVLEETSVIISY